MNQRASAATKAAASTVLSSGPHLMLQRQCACGQHTIGGGECEGCSKKRIESSFAGGRLLHRRTADAAEPSGVPPIVYDVLRSPGQPLDAATRAFFEPRFSYDFSQVRAHAEPRDPAVRRTGLDLNDYVRRNGSSGAIQAGKGIQRLDAGGSADTPDAGPGASPDAGLVPSPAGTPAPVAAAPAFPTANFERFVTAGAVRCCRIAGAHGCPGHLGPSVAGDPRDQNGMNLVFKIVGHRPPVEYGFVQVIHASVCSRASAARGGAWTQVLAQGPGADDSPVPGATCTRPNAADEITMTDGPGFETALGGADMPGVDEMTLRMNATDWVIARERPGSWKRISDLFVWHTINRIRRNAAGNWELAAGGNRIGQAATRIGGCPPPP